MKKTFKRTSAFVCAMAVMAAPMTFSSFVANADGETVTSDYTLTIPATLNVENVGWNSIGNISATGTLESGKKLTVTAASTNSWALKSGENSVSYTLNNGSDTKGDAATSWDFTSLPASQAIGIDVSDYSEKPAGTYTDTVTFTASVEDAAKPYALGGQPINNGTVIKVNFKWRDDNSGDYVQGTYNADSGTFTASKGGSDWGRDNRAVYKVEKSGDNIIIGAGFYDYTYESMVWTFNTTNDTYTTTNGEMVNEYPGEYGLISVTLNGTDITSQLTKQ